MLVVSLVCEVVVDAVIVTHGLIPFGVLILVNDAIGVPFAMLDETEKTN